MPVSAVRMHELLARADRLRDDRRWAEAAIAYREVLEQSPSLPPIWVQLGHALKEAGRRNEAESAYRESLRLAPDVADTHLQLGHVLKLLGRREEALEAFAKALRIDRHFLPAIHELVALGEGWRAGSETGAGLDLMARTLSLAEQLRRTQAQIEAQLPAIASLVSFAPSGYQLFRRQYRVPPPPRSEQARPDFAVIVLDHGNPLATVMRVCNAIVPQEPPPAAVSFVTEDAANAACFDRIRGACGAEWRPAMLAASSADLWQRVAAELRECTTEWVVLLSGEGLLGPNALSWFGYAAATGAVVVYGDEDHVEFDADGEAVLSDPIFKSAYDAAAIEAGGDPGCVLAFRRDVAIAATERAVARAEPPELRSVLLHAAEQGAVAHIPRVLSSRIRDGLRSAGAGTPPLRSGSREAASASDETICAIVPTRDGQALLQRCIASLQATAGRPERLQIIIVDNGSSDPDTLEYLTAAVRDQSVTVIRDETPFNWSLLNNRAASQTSAPILAFVNNDIEMITRSWDESIRSCLSHGKAGIVGAKLLYPDDTIQHAGIVFGPNGRTEHEGVGEPASAAGPQGRWVRRRRTGAVTGAFLACRAAEFNQIGGFDARELPVWYSDVDFCLKMRRLGRHVLFEPAIRAVHHESKTVRAVFPDPESEAYWRHGLAVMRARWGRAFVTDPGFNPHFSRWAQPFAAIGEPSADAVIEHLRRSATADPWCPAE
ncbi:MAG: glycosyltransferase [Alphaproteobacteria bacterium]|nr:glycosyltransferase [Alphaproteobacteria bacterium]